MLSVNFKKSTGTYGIHVTRMYICRLVARLHSAAVFFCVFFLHRVLQATKAGLEAWERGYSVYPCVDIRLALFPVSPSHVQCPVACSMNNSWNSEPEEDR